MLRIYTSNCFLAWMSVFVWYAIKIDIRPRPVSIFGDYGAIKENIYVMLRKQAGKWQHQTSRQSLHSWEFCIRLWRCFSDSLKIVSFQMQQFSFPIHSQVTFNSDKGVKELQMERFGMVTPQEFAKQFQKWEFPNMAIISNAKVPLKEFHANDWYHHLNGHIHRQESYNLIASLHYWVSEWIV